MELLTKGLGMPLNHCQYCHSIVCDCLKVRAMACMFSESHGVLVDLRNMGPQVVDEWWLYNTGVKIGEVSYSVPTCSASKGFEIARLVAVFSGRQVMRHDSILRAGIKFGTLANHCKPFLFMQRLDWSWYYTDEVISACRCNKCGANLPAPNMEEFIEQYRYEIIPEKPSIYCRSCINKHLSCYLCGEIISQPEYGWNLDGHPVRCCSLQCANRTYEERLEWLKEKRRTKKLRSIMWRMKKELKSPSKPGALESLKRELEQLKTSQT